MTNIYITSKGGQLVAEVNDVKTYELSDCIADLGFGFGDSFSVEYDMDDEGSDVWGLIDEIYCQFRGEEAYEDMVEDSSSYLC